MRRFLDLFTFKRLLWILVVLNVIDGVSTHLALKLGIAWELNPLLRWAFQTSPDLFWLIKSALLAVSVYFLGRLADTKGGRTVAVLANVLYLGVIGIHAYGWTSYFLSQ